MVIAAEFLCVALVFAGAPDQETVSAPIGVIRGGEGVEPRPGLISARTVVRTNDVGWAELHLLDGGRLWLFASTEVQLRAGPTIRMINGRIWLQTHREAKLEVRDGMGSVRAGTSVIVDDTRSGGLLVAARAGRATIGSVEVGPGQVWRRPVLGTSGPPRRGGDQLADLVRRQTETLVGDWSGLDRWLQVELRQFPIGSPRGLSPGGVVRAEQEAAGASSSRHLTEFGLRPPPFFDEEVPSRGPNVRVEVDFADD